MARKNVAFKLVRQNEDNEENLKDYIKPVSLYHKLGERSKNSPYFLRRSLNYIIQAKKENQTNSDGTIIFDYMDRRNKTLKVEVVNKFSCPFCSVPCGVFEGLQFHLTSSHYVFEYKFREDEAHGHEVDVSLKQERVKFGGGEQWTPFMFRSKRRRLRQGNDSNMMKPLNVRFLRLDINQLPSDTEIEVTNVNDERISTQPLTDQSTDILSPTQPEIQPPTGQTSDIASPTQPEIGQSSEPQEVLPVNRRKKLRAKRATAKRLDRLKSRQFYHSRTMQPMTYEEVIADEDSEDEGDDDEADLNERLRLERIKKVSKEEKRYMYLWNIFIRKQRVFADGHVTWACEAFTKLHKEEMKTSKSFRMWWMLFSIKLYNCGLICGKTINNCSNILLSSDETGPSTYNAAANANNLQSMEVDEE